MPLPFPSDASLLLWSTLGQPVLDDGAKPWVNAVLERAIAHPDVDHNLVWQDETLLMRALERMKSGPLANLPLLQPGEAPVARADEVPVLSLLEHGAQPWAAITVSPKVKASSRILAGRGLAAFDLALRTQAWASLEAFLKDARRPAWDELLNAPFRGSQPLCHVLMEHPSLVTLFLRAGVDPNWRNAKGTPLLFHVGHPAAAQWLIEVGADPKARDSEGRNLLQYCELRQRQISEKMTETDRRVWVTLMGLDQVNSVQVVEQGLKGRLAMVRPLFETERAMQNWRWTPPEFSREISLLDVGAMAMMTRGAELNSLAKSIGKKASTHGARAQRLWWLAKLSESETTPNAPKLTSEQGPRLLEAVEDFLQLEKAWRGRGMGSKEPFGCWFAHAPDPATQKGVLDGWLTWLEGQGERWEAAGSMTGPLNALSVPESFQEQSSLHKAAILGHQVAKEIRRQVTTGLTHWRVQDNLILQATQQCFAWLQEAQTDLNAAPWKDLCERLFESRLGAAIRASARQERAGEAEDASSAPSARRRSRP